MKLWIDDTRPAPPGFIWCKTVNEAKLVITCIRQMRLIEHKANLPDIELIDTDHDAGYYANFGGDYIRVLDWLEEQGWSYPIHIHSMNPVGVHNMRAIIRHNGWKEVL